MGKVDDHQPSTEAAAAAAAAVPCTDAAAAVAAAAEDGEHPALDGDSDDEGFCTAGEDEEGDIDAAAYAQSAASSEQDSEQEQGEEPEPEPEMPAVDTRTGLVLTHTAFSMPPTRKVWRVPVEVVFDEDATGAALQPRCAHPSCRNNPNCKAPFDRDCSPNRTEDGMPPGGVRKVLLHSCCAPCSGAMFEEMLSKGLDVTIFFYNPNIHPRKEYEIRKEENKRYAARHNVPFVDCDYDQTSWFERMKGYEYDPERGVRCTACFDMRMEVTAAYAAEHGFGCFTTTNATSRWKDVRQVNDSGLRAALQYKGKVQFWEYNWQTDAMTKRKYEVSAEERFYKQEYCGCSYSLRDSNLWRKSQGIPPVRIGGETAGLGTRYFEDPEADAAEESQEVVDAFFADAEKEFGDESLRVKKLQKQFEGRQKMATSAAEGLNNW